MEATLDRPEVEVLDRAELNDGKVVVAYSRTEAALTDLRARLEGKTWDLTTTAGNTAARAARKELVGLRTSLEAKRKELKAPALAMGKLIDAEAQRIEGAILALESPIDAAIKADEQRREEERRAAAEAEARRVAALRERLKFLTDAPARAVGKTSVELDRIAATLEAAPVNEATFAEFLPEALQARDESLAVLREMRAATRRAEDEAAQLKAERARIEREEHLRRRLHELRSLGIGMMGRSPAELREALDALDTVDVSAATWGDFAAQAVEARGEVHSDLQRMLAAAVDREAQRVEAQRLAAVAAEQAEVQRRQDEAARAARQAEVDANAERDLQRARELQAEFDANCAKARAAVPPAPAPELVQPTPILSDKAVADANARAFVDRIDGPATLALGAICKRLDPDGGLKLTAAFLADRLHVAPAATDGSARLFTEAQFQTICRQLQSHISAMAELYAGSEA